jgi:ribosomal protein L11 methyltransferase
MNKQTWQCLRLEVPSACSEELGARAYALGSCGLQAEEAGERTRLSIYFATEPDFDLAMVRRELELALAALDLAPPLIEVDCVEAEDWEEDWRRFFRPVWATPRIVVHPSWIPVETKEDQVAIVIDPKMAFGTGGHESTQLCLQALDRFLSPQARCLDLGTGSGILSIAAALLGAESVLAVDVDEVAVVNARENLARNAIAEQCVEVRTGSLEVVGEASFDLILANIQSHILRPLLTPIDRLLKPVGLVLFSGLLVREGADFCGWVEDAGLQIETTMEKGEWICVVARNAR